MTCFFVLPLPQLRAQTALKIRQCWQLQQKAAAGQLRSSHQCVALRMSDRRTSSNARIVDVEGELMIEPDCESSAPAHFRNLQTGHQAWSDESLSASSVGHII